MGFWHTGYLEFHEPTGLEPWSPPAPKVYRCSQCGKEYDTDSSLRQHRFEAHPFKSPKLFIRGMEVASTPITVTRAFSVSDFDTGACSTANVNGKTIHVDQLGEVLAPIQQDTVRIVLEGDGVKASFEIRIDIASDKDILGVEEVFLELVLRRRLDVRAIEQFIDSASKYKTAAGYCDGICDYLYGVLIKERSSSTTLPYEEYRDKFTRALDKLGTYDRPLSNRICGLIEFNYNHFQEAAFLSPDSRVGHAATVFSRWLVESSPSKGQKDNLKGDERLELMLTDLDTEKLVSWSVKEPSELVDDGVQIEKMLLTEPAEYDQLKLHILLVQIGVHSKNREMVARHASNLRHNPTVGEWARRVMKTISAWGAE